jgi:hypothetical protein
MAGHGRLSAAKLLNLASVPVVVLADMTEADRRAYILADNKLAEQAGWAKAGTLEASPDRSATGGVRVGSIASFRPCADRFRCYPR